jgi:aspartyl protease family protein
MRKKRYSIKPYGINLFKISAVVGGKEKGLFGKLFLLIDTGSSFTIISQTIVEELGYDFKKIARRQQIITGKGLTTPIPVIKVSWFNCAGKIVNNFDVLAYDIPRNLKVDGILGMDFLVKFRSLISLASNNIYFESDD